MKRSPNTNNKLLKFSILILTVLGLIISFSSCKKENPEPEITTPTVESQELSYDSLVVAAAQVYLNDAVNINAFATGDDLTYTWTIDVGALLGSGSTVTFSACCTGIHNITCVIGDAYGNSDSKSVTIKVL